MSKLSKLSKSKVDKAKILTDDAVITKITPPKVKASQYEEGYEDVGSDDTTVYVVKTDKNGKHRWAKKEGSAKKSATSSKSASKTTENTVKKERVKRGPTKYNLFIGAKLRELREENPNLKNTEYMQLAIDIWKSMSDDEKKAIAVAA